MVTVNFDTEPDDQGAIDGFALAREMIVSAYDHAMAALPGESDRVRGAHTKQDSKSAAERKRKPAITSSEICRQDGRNSG